MRVLPAILFVLLISLDVSSQIRVSPSDVNAYSQGPTSVLLTYGGLVNKTPGEATWCGSLISAAPDLGMKCDPNTTFGLLPQRYNQSVLNSTTYTDVMSVTPQVARRAYLDAVAGNTSTFFYVRRFASTVGGPSEFVPVTIRLTGNGAGVSLSLTEVKLSWGTGTPILFVRSGEQLPRVRAEISYTGTGRLKGRWELVKPGEAPPEPRDLLTEASLPIEERGSQKRYTELERFNIYLPPDGKVVLQGPDSSRVDESLSGLYLLLLRIEASDDKDSETDRTAAGGAGSGIVSTGAVAGFPLPTLRYYVGGNAAGTSVPGALTLVSPKEAEELDSSKAVEFTWSAVDKAASYRLEITTLQGTPILSAILVDQVSYHCPSWFKDRVAGSVIRWKVEAYDAQRNQIAETDWRNLKVIGVNGGRN
ncbi:MAG: hypothetical protein C5B55_01095 [Blastocatellia bacterium]|nr:MAG: hypothetical protein C5B55_01095 [Blastocatellia bacterium]